LRNIRNQAQVLPRLDQSRCPKWVKLRKTQCEQMFSELPLKADIARCSRHISNMPEADIETDLNLALAKLRFYVYDSRSR